MVSAVDVGQYIYDKLGWIDAWRLEKLTYYCQAWSLGWYGKPLVNEEFQAWPDGPVEPKLFRLNKHGRSGDKSTVLPTADVSLLDKHQRAIIDAVLEFYGAMTKKELIELTHAESPWLKARAGLGEKEYSTNPISQAEMKRCYSLQEIEKVGVPRRPKLEGLDVPRESKARKTADIVESALDRWKSALDILAMR